jgi:hypothetical protein
VNRAANDGAEEGKPEAPRLAAARKEKEKEDHPEQHRDRHFASEDGGLSPPPTGLRHRTYPTGSTRSEPEGDNSERRRKTWA